MQITDPVAAAAMTDYSHSWLPGNVVIHAHSTLACPLSLARPADCRAEASN